jgi:hypothetical protein
MLVGRDWPYRSQENKCGIEVQKIQSVGRYQKKKKKKELETHLEALSQIAGKKER